MWLGVQTGGREMKHGFDSNRRKLLLAAGVALVPMGLMSCGGAIEETAYPDVRPPSQAIRVFAWTRRTCTSSPKFSR